MKRSSIKRKTPLRAKPRKRATASPPSFEARLAGATAHGPTTFHAAQHGTSGVEYVYPFGGSQERHEAMLGLLGQTAEAFADKPEGTVVVIGPKTDQAGELTVPPGSWSVVRGVYVGPTGRWQMDLVPAAPEPKRRGPWRSPEYLAFVRSKPCCVCGRPGPSEAHHHGPRGAKGMGTKCSDVFVCPLDRACHNDWHSMGHFSGKTREQSEAIQVESQRLLLAEWVSRGA